MDEPNQIGSRTTVNYSVFEILLYIGGMFSIMPATTHIKVSEQARESWFSHKTEIARPYYYSVYLAVSN